MRCPLGDQPATSSLSGVEVMRVVAPVARSSTNTSWFVPLPRGSTTREKAIRPPSGDQAGRLSYGPLVRLQRPDPSAFITAIRPSSAPWPDWST
jgi:hypothetical protein